MVASVYNMPTRIVTGNGCFEELGAIAQGVGSSALIVCGGEAMRRFGALDRALGLLESAGVFASVYDGIRGEPTLDMVQGGIERFRKSACDLAIGLGGGSAMDGAKAIAGLTPLDGSVAEYHAGRALEGPSHPVIAVPTTAGTGAEVTKNAVILDPELGVKKSIRGDDWFPTVALVDPELTLSVPPSVTANSGSDAFCQALEAYVSIGAMPVTDALCEDAIWRMGRSLARVVEAGDDIAAREDMLYGSLLAGMAFSNARLGAVHGIAHPLGARYHLAHGSLCGLLLPHVMRYNVDHAAPKYALVANIVGVGAGLPGERDRAMAAVEWVGELVARIGVPASLTELGVPRSDWSIIAEQSLTSSSLQHNPRPIGTEDVYAILEAAS